MSGIKDLNTLLSNIRPELDKEEYVFTTFPVLNWDKVQQLNPVGFFREKEGITLIITRNQATANHIPYDAVYKLITLNVHSSLDAVGLTAAFSAKLTEKNISANVVAAYYHDHIFVPEAKALQALTAISDLRV